MMRLLFVDDEPRVLQGLRQVLRRKRQVWELVFAEGGAAALSELEREQFDAVVSDMRMPGMDGAELLARVRDLQPGALRIILSGQMDEGAAVRAASAAHRFLSKPCDSEVLIATLSRALALHQRLSSDEMRRCIGNMAGLPSPPASCVALASALKDEHADLAEVTQAIEADVGTSVKVLQLVNSAFFGLPRHVASVEVAVRYLGVKALRSLVVAQALFQELSGNDATQLADEQSKSLLAARFARAFPLSGQPAEAAVTAALLHNVGRMVLLARRSEDYAACREHARSSGVGLETAEREWFGVTNAEVGAYLLGLWGLPDEVMEAVAAYPAALADGAGPLEPSQVVHLSQWLARQMMGQAETPAPDPGVLARLGLSELMARLQAEGTVAVPHDPS